MKKTSAELFDLIKSLSKTEKRYFKIYARRHFLHNNTYLKLFCLIDTQQEYHEAALIKKISYNKSASHFAVVKKQLYENMLDALHRFDEYAHPEQEVIKGIHYCALLLKKGLFSQCKKQIAKYKSLAYTIEKFENILEIIDIEKRLISRQQYTTHNPEALKKLHEEQNACLRQIQIAGDYWLMSSRIFKMHYEKIIAPGKENTALQQLITENHFNQLHLATNMRCKLDYLQVNALHAFVNGELQKAYQLNTQFLKLLDDNPQFKILFSDRYFSVLNNYLIDSLLLKNYEQLLAGINTLRLLSAQREFKHINNLEANIFRLGYLLELNYYVSTKQFTKALRCKPSIEQGLKKYAKKITRPNIITLRYLIAYTQFCIKNFDKCLDEVNTILQTKDAEQVTDIYRDSRMLQLLCHFEMGNYQLLESLLISFSRLEGVQKQRMQTYKIILQYIKQYISKINKPALQILQEQIQKLSERSEEKSAFNNFDYLYWATDITGIHN